MFQVMYISKQAMFRLLYFYFSSDNSKQAILNRPSEHKGNFLLITEVK
jgi:hypothetical protein